VHQLWAGTQLGVSGVVVTDVVHWWFIGGSSCYGMIVYVSGGGCCKHTYCPGGARDHVATS